MDAVVLGLRVLLSLAVVFGLLWYLHHKISRFNRTSNKADPVTVVTRQGLSPKASVVMIEAEGRRFLLGVTDQSVNVLHTSAAPGLASVPDLADDDDSPGRTGLAERTDADDATFARVLSLATASGEGMPVDAKRSGRRAARPAGARPHSARSPMSRSPLSGSPKARQSPLAGSILSPETWKQTAAALRQGRAG